MKIITRQSRANTILRRWADHYDVKNNPQFNDKAKAFIKLKELGDNPNPDEVDKIIGDGTWTEVPICTECGIKTNMVVQIGFCKYGEECVYLCKKCLADINKIAKSVKIKKGE